MKQFIWISLLFLGFWLFSSHLSVVQAQENFPVIYEGRVTKILETGQESMGEDLVDYQFLEILIDGGELIGVKNSKFAIEALDNQYQTYQVNDRIKLVAQNTPDGIIYNLDGKLKRPTLVSLTLLFVLVVIVVGRVWGATSILGLLASFGVIFKIIIPLIISGTNPVLAAVIGSIIIIPTTFYLAHGFNTKTHVGVVATLMGLIVTGFLAVYFVNAAHLTGFASEEAGFLQVERSGTIDIRGLLLAGIIIGTLGILDDVTIGQASTVLQLKLANPDLNMLELYKKGMSVGQDHISSMVNTLVLVYSGSALPLLLLFFDSQKSFLDIIEFELIAEEIVRMLVGSIGLVLAAPLATILAAYLFANAKTVGSLPTSHHR